MSARSPLNLQEWLGARSAIWLAASLLACGLIAWADYQTGTEVGFSIFYLIPILLVSARFGTRAGLAAAAGCGILWLILNAPPSGKNASHPYAGLWNTAIRFGFFSLAVGLSRTYLSYREEREVSRLKTEIFSLASHELNNAVALLSMTVVLLKESEPERSNERRAKFYEILERSMRRIKETTRSFLDQARLETGHFSLDFQEVFMRPLVRGVADNLTPLREDKEIDLQLHIPDRTVPVRADPKAMQLIMTNLIGNAIKYTPKGGRVIVSLTGLPGQRAEISVEDTGIGIKPAERAAVVSGFYRTEAAKDMAKGHGIGLKITKEMIALHGGELEIESAAGRGSRFHFTLPLWETPGTASRPGASQIP